MAWAVAAALVAVGWFSGSAPARAEYLELPREAVSGKFSGAHKPLVSPLAASSPVAVATPSPVTGSPAPVTGSPTPVTGVSSPAPAAMDAGRFARGHILVQPNAGLSSEQFAKILSPHGGKAEGRIGSLDVYVVTLPAAASEKAVAAALARNPHIKFAEVDALIPAEFTPDDAYYGSAWHLPMVSAPTAWDVSQGSGVTVAILDSGVDPSHPDLAGRLVPGWNYWDNNSDTADVFGHGTKVAGVVAAVANNGIGVAGVAWNAKLMPVRVTDTGGYASISAIASGLSYAASHGARVANLSFAVQSYSTVISAAQQFKNKGGLVVNSAGNYGALDSTSNSDALISVSATDSGDNRAGWSSYGPYVDLAGPGVGIWTTTMGGGYGAPSGTSFSSPLVAAVAGLVMAANSRLAPSQVESVLKSTAVDLGTAGADPYFGSGRVNAGAAVMAAAAGSTADTQAPSVAIAAPTGGTVSGIVPVSMAASDNVGVVRVDLLVNGALVSSDSSTPYAVSWDSTAAAGNNAQLVARAYDAAGNSASSQTVTVAVASSAGTDTTPPTVSVTSPTGGTVSGVVTVNVSATDDVGVTRVDLMLNGALYATATALPYTFAWDSSAGSPASATLGARAYDAAGNLGSSSDVTVTVSAGTSPADTTPPTISITGPGDGSTVSGMVTIGATATDNVGVTGMTLRIDGSVVASGNRSSISYKWNTRKASAGAHTISATAKDGAGNQATRTISVTK